MEKALEKDRLTERKASSIRIRDRIEKPINNQTKKHNKRSKNRIKHRIIIKKETKNSKHKSSRIENSNAKSTEPNEEKFGIENIIMFNPIIINNPT